MFRNSPEILYRAATVDMEALQQIKVIVKANMTNTKYDMGQVQDGAPDVHIPSLLSTQRSS